MNVPGTESHVDAGALQKLVTDIFVRCHMAERDAVLLADSLVFADLRGVHSHGVLRVPEYVVKLTTGGVNPAGQPRVVHDSGACLVVDGGNSMGQIGAHFAMEKVLERAKTTGIAAAGIRGSNHCGALAYFAMLALDQDMIGIATTNALPTMAPWGGAERILGINPLAVAIPANQEYAIVHDAAFSGSSHGKIRIYQQRGLDIPPGWALDREGNSTTDATAAVDGLLMPIGGFKGTGLALVMGILSSLLSGAAYGAELGDMEEGPKAGQDGHFLAAIRVAAFEDVGRFKQRVDKAIRQIHACRRAPGVDRIYAPGEVEFLLQATRLEHGIPLNPVTMAGLIQTAEGLGIGSHGLTA